MNAVKQCAYLAYSQRIRIDSSFESNKPVPVENSIIFYSTFAGEEYVQDFYAFSTLS